MLDGHISNLFCQVSSPLSFQAVLRSSKHRYSESRDFTSDPSNIQLDDEVTRNTTSLNVIERETDVEIQTHLYLLQRAWKFSRGNPNPIIGSGTAFDALNFLPIERTMRNAELIYFCKAILFIQIIITLIIAISSPVTGSFICHNWWQRSTCCILWKVYLKYCSIPSFGKLDHSRLIMLSSGSTRTYSWKMRWGDCHRRTSHIAHNWLSQKTWKKYRRWNSTDRAISGYAWGKMNIP